MNDWLELFAGALLLYFGAEWFVGGASSLALLLRVPKVVVGLTVVAYGTSAPEAVVSMHAAMDARGAVALGNIVGSNIVNVGLILGLTAVLKPPQVHGTLRARELPVLLLTGLSIPFLLRDAQVSRLEGGILLACAILYTAWMVRSTRNGVSLSEAQLGTALTVEAAEAAGAPTTRTVGFSILSAAIGLGVLLLGGSLFVEGAVGVSLRWGISERVVGLTVVAIGTSLPELVTSVIAARRGHSELAVGNVVGSNIFNVLLCLGAAALAAPLPGSLAAMGSDLAMLAVMTLMGAAFIRSERLVSRLEGGAALLAYLFYTISLVWEA